MHPTVLLQASARPRGNTYHFARQLAREMEADHLDLLRYTVNPYSYQQEYPAGDDFIRLVEKEILPRDTIIFASPVYWYTMSGTMKIFLDRFSDLLQSRKDLGRQLRGKRMAVLSVGSDEVHYPSFFASFRLSAEYLGMHYGPEWHAWLEEGEARLVKLPLP